jgi:hypothetical protein
VANFTGVNFTDAKLQLADFNGSGITSTSLVDFSGANTRFATGLPSLLPTATTTPWPSLVLPTTPSIGNKDANKILLLHDFSGLTINSSSFQNSTLIGSTFAGATLDGDTFKGADLVGVSFKGATLIGDNFTSAILTGANFTGATLEEDTFTNASLELATFKNATITYTDFTNADAQGANFDPPGGSGSGSGNGSSPPEHHEHSWSGRMTASAHWQQQGQGSEDDPPSQIEQHDPVNTNSGFDTYTVHGPGAGNPTWSRGAAPAAWTHREQYEQQASEHFSRTIGTSWHQEMPKWAAWDHGSGTHGGHDHHHHPPPHH